MTGPYKIGTLSRLTGFSPAVLRAWERRFALLAPERGTGGQRLYTDDDLRLLTRVRALVDEGRTIGEIARAGRDALLVPAAIDLAPADTETHRASPAVADWQRRIIAAARALNVRDVSATIAEAFAALAAEDAIDQVLVPVAREVGRLWETGACSIASEHLVSDQFLHRVRRLLDAAQPADVGAPTAVAACFPDEQHQLGLAILSWHLARRGVRVAYCGAAVPVADLADAASRSGCRAIVLSVTRRSLFTAHHRSIVKSLRGSPPVFVGGPGVPNRPAGDGAIGDVAWLPRLSAAEAIDRVVSRMRLRRDRQTARGRA